MKTNNKPSNRRPASKKTRLPRWKLRIHDYRTDEVSNLFFPTEKDMDAALELVWVGRLQGMPFTLGGDGESLVVPKKGIPFFTKVGIQFIEREAKLS